jgi:hypothetical protein
MHSVAFSVASALTLFAAPALAGGPAPSAPPEKSMTTKDVTAKDVVETPASDLNLKKDEIPALLVAAQQHPYTLTGLATCQQLAAAIGEFDALLGEDVDLPQSDGKRTSPGRVAQSVVGSFIPFRGVIREVSGANEHDREMRAAILAGVARRSFLKGIGQGKNCRYPARSATLEVFNEKMATLGGVGDAPKTRAANAEPSPARGTNRTAPATVRYVSQPVVQQTD